MMQLQTIGEELVSIMKDMLLAGLVAGPAAMVMTGLIIGGIAWRHAR